jgi:L-ribulokinase
MLVHQTERYIPGFCGVAKGGILPDLYGYEAGLTAAGDIFDWFVRFAFSYANAGSAEHAEQFDRMEYEAGQLTPGGGGVVSNEWLNGSRTPHNDSRLSGALVGLRLDTGPAAVYRSLIESVAFATRRVVELLDKAGIHTGRLIACGGISQRSPLLMQVMADVCRVPVLTTAFPNVPALGSAMYGAVAASERTGYASIFEASEQMHPQPDRIYEPIKSNVVVYKALYELYLELDRRLMEGGPTLMHKLHETRRAARESREAEG